MKWKCGDTTYSLHWFCLCVDTPNEADLLVIYGLFYLGGWHWGWPEAV